MRIRNVLRGLFGRSMFHPGSWVPCAVFIVVVFGILHFLGWRDDTAIISGTVTRSSAEMTAVYGVIYGLAYFGAVIVSPILLIAAGVYWVGERVGTADKRR